MATAGGEWQDLRWNMSLESSPIIVQIGENTHGRESDETFRLPDLWCIHLYAYDAEVEVDGRPLPIHPGYVGITPPGATTLYHFLGRSPHYYAHFSISSVGATYPVPAMRDLGESYPSTVDAFREAVRFWPINRQRSIVRLWDILWQLADISHDAPPTDDMPAPVRNVIAYVDSHLHEPLTVERLADQESISHNHLTRLFRASQGCTPQQYIQNRRVAQARHLLVYSSMPIKAVAASIGIDDPHIFNKFVKHYLGCSPRRLRDDEAPKVGLLE